MNLVTAKLVTFDQEQASLLFLYEKLKSYGNIDAFRLAETLKKYYEFFENMDKLHADESFNETDLKNDEDYKDYCIKNSELLEVYSNVPLITWKLKTNYKSNMLEITEIGFNKLLYSLLSESKSDFIEGLMKNGFPDCIHTQENYFKFIEMMITQAFFQNNAQGHDLWCYIICKGYPKIPAKLKFKSNSFKKGNYYEHFLIDYFEINKKDSNNLEKYKQTRLNLKERMKNYKKKQRFFIDQNRPFSKDSLEFLTNFYPNIEISKKNNEDELRCKIKEIKELG